MGNIKQINKNIFASADKNKEVLEKYTELWDEIRKLNEK